MTRQQKIFANNCAVFPPNPTRVWQWIEDNDETVDKQGFQPWVLTSKGRCLTVCQHQRMADPTYRYHWYEHSEQLFHDEDWVRFIVAFILKMVLIGTVILRIDVSVTGELAGFNILYYFPGLDLIGPRRRLVRESTNNLWRPWTPSSQASKIIE